jgi:hypothetical protein
MNTGTGSGWDQAVALAEKMDAPVWAALEVLRSEAAAATGNTPTVLEVPIAATIPPLL